MGALTTHTLICRVFIGIVGITGPFHQSYGAIIFTYGTSFWRNHFLPFDGAKY